MSATIHAAASVTPPTQDDNIIVIAGTASSASKFIPDSWRGQWITIQAQGDAFFFALGKSDMTVDQTKATTITSAAVQTFDGDECVYIPDGQSRDYDLKKIAKDVTHWAIKGTGTSGFVRITRSSGYASVD